MHGCTSGRDLLSGRASGHRRNRGIEDGIERQERTYRVRRL